MNATSADIRAGRAFIEIFLNDAPLKKGLLELNKDLDSFARGITGAGLKAAALSAAFNVPAVRALSVYANFEHQMAKVAAITKATSSELDALKYQAKELGRTTFFTSGQVANAQKFLGMAGYDAKRVKAALPAVLELSLVGEIDLGHAADIVTNISTPFKIAAENISKVTDIIAQAATTSNTNIQEMGDAFKYAAASASASNQSIEEMAASISILANSGIKASMAGTSIRRMVGDLAMDKYQTKLKELLDIDVTDFTGKMRPLLTILSEMGEKTSRMTQAQQVSIFFDIFGERAANSALLLARSSDAIVDFRIKMLESAGVASTAAKTITNTIYGDWRMFISAVEATQIAYGDAMNGMARSTLQFGTDFVRGISLWIRNHEGLVQSMSSGVVGVTAISAAFIGLGQVIRLGASSWDAYSKVFSKVRSGLIGLAAAEKAVTTATKTRVSAQAQYQGTLFPTQMFTSRSGTQPLLFPLPPVNDVNNITTAVNKTETAIKGANLASRAWGVSMGILKMAAGGLVSVGIFTGLSLLTGYVMKLIQGTKTLKSETQALADKYKEFSREELRRSRDAGQLVIDKKDEIKRDLNFIKDIEKYSGIDIGKNDFEYVSKLIDIIGKKYGDLGMIVDSVNKKIFAPQNMKQNAFSNMASALVEAEEKNIKQTEDIYKRNRYKITESVKKLARSESTKTIDAVMHGYGGGGVGGTTTVVEFDKELYDNKLKSYMEEVDSVIMGGIYKYRNTVLSDNKSSFMNSILYTDNDKELLSQLARVPFKTPVFQSFINATQIQAICTNPL